MRSAARWNIVVLLAALVEPAPQSIAATVGNTQQPDARPVGQAPQTLLLDLYVNGASAGFTVEAQVQSGALLIDRTDLERARILTSPTDSSANGKIDVNHIDGIGAQIDSATQRILLSVASNRLLRQEFDLRVQKAAPTQEAGTGVIASYDVSSTMGNLARLGRATQIGATTEITAFAPFGTLTADGFVQGGAGDGRAVVLDTTMEFDDASLMRRVLVGDFVSDQTSWSRAVRLAGIQIGTDFTLDPGFIARPLPEFFGQAAAPSTVDVFVNSVHQFESGVDAGPFALHNIPALTGSGDVSVVVTDILGRQTTQTISLYTDDTLLRQGLWSYGADAGFMRPNYGLESFDYGMFASSGTVRYGLTNGLTLESHAEASGDVQLAGVGAAFSIGQLGVASVNAAESNAQGSSGSACGFSVQHRGGALSLFASASSATSNWRDLASFGGPLPPRLQLQLGGSYELDRASSLSASFLATRAGAEAPPVASPISQLSSRSGVSADLTTVTYSRNLSGGWYLSSSGIYDETRRAWSFQLVLTVPTVKGAYASSQATASRDTDQVQLSAAHPADPDGGFGYHVQGLLGNDDGAEGDVTWYGQHTSASAGLSISNGQAAAQLDASGGLVFMDGSVFATRQPNGAVALVRTGLEGIGIERENRLVAQTDSDGEALLTGLTADAPNHISVDVRDYPLDATIDNPDQIVVPPRRSGITLEFAPAGGRPALVTFLLLDGTPPPAGTSILLNGAPSALPVAFGGEAYFADIRGKAHVAFAIDGRRYGCDVVVPAHRLGDGIPKVGPVYCRADNSRAVALSGSPR